MAVKWRTARKGVEPVITVIKQTHAGEEKWRYQGEILDRGPNWIQIQAFFDRPDIDDGYVVFRRGDRFVEWYYADRWYNIFQIHDVDDDRIKGWYCNVTRPASITDHAIGWPDLALDVWVSPVGEILVLDEDEYEVIRPKIDESTHRSAWHAIDEIRDLVARRVAPFDQLTFEGIQNRV